MTTATPPPSWFRLVVWDALLGSLCPLLPIPFLDDLALARVRRRMVRRIAGSAGVALAPAQRRRLAGGGRGWSAGGCAAKLVLYPIKKIFRKVLYFLAVKDAVDTLSLLFHQGYLLQTALASGALSADPGDEPVGRLAGALHDTLEAVDTRPLGRIVGGIFASSGRLVGATLRWAARSLVGRRGVEELEAEGADPRELDEASPEAEALLERLLVALWNEKGYRRRLEEELRRRLEDRHHPATRPDPAAG